MVISRILVVEDEAIVTADTENQLQCEGYTVANGVSIAEMCFLLVEKLHPDFILMDIHLSSVIDGVGTVKKSGERFDVSIFYIMSYDEKDVYQRAEETNPFGYILKPFELSELRHTVEMTICRHEMERKLTEYEECHSLISELTVDFADSVYVDPDGYLIPEGVSKACVHISGYTREESDISDEGKTYPCSNCRKMRPEGSRKL